MLLISLQVQGVYTGTFFQNDFDSRRNTASISVTCINVVRPIHSSYLVGCK